MAVKKIAYLVFVFPIIASLIFGGYVLSDVLGQPDRQLNMWQFKFPSTIGQQQGDKQIRLLNLVSNYTVSTPLNFRVLVNDTSFDCGDLYMTIYDPNTSPKQVIIQNAYFTQCFAQTNSSLPIQDTFSPVIDKPGIYQIVAEMKDKTNQNSISVMANIRVQ
ncbi:hypothetical protein [Candidatus Nitrosotalea okcheonensis]|uniref:Uncharacterized protein n=1 Tax=Candidatus Nitrosotalea okcheonensis TaxID=1903276 RepID=A0A2H1FFT4_9ARCH|nr:hypothetical protein [Candidatus Nitrosotalea okcheonensis]SMH71616.1 conserved exported protein of unknown function [Candidatus Nitrosotalea okcheonensis]